MKYCLTILLMACTAAAQVPDIKNLGNYQEIARDALIIYYINIPDAIRTGQEAVVDTLGAHYGTNPGSETEALDNTAYIVTTWRINCQKRVGYRLKDVGVWQSRPVNKIYKNPKADKPNRTRNLYLAIEEICGPSTAAKDTYQWKGGNGCDLIGGGKHEKACCVEHDFSYRTGGGMRQKWQADSELFKCVWRRNKFLAPFVFVGTQVGGLWAFHWGKRRKLTREPAISVIKP